MGKSLICAQWINVIISWTQHNHSQQTCEYENRAYFVHIFVIAWYRGFIYINGQYVQIVFMFSVRATPAPTNQNINVNSNGGKKSYYANETF